MAEDLDRKTSRCCWRCGSYEYNNRQFLAVNSWIHACDKCWWGFKIDTLGIERRASQAMVLLRISEYAKSEEKGTKAAMDYEDTRADYINAAIEFFGKERFTANPKLEVKV